jgi:hypothetical protein
MTREYLALKDLFIIEGSDEGKKCFTSGKLYSQIYPDIWPPDPSCKFCLLDDNSEEHFMTRNYIDKNFEYKSKYEVKDQSTNQQ